MIVQAIAGAATPGVAAYIRSQRNRLYGMGQALSADQKNVLSAYFDEVDLSRVRLVVADPLPIGEPPFTGLLRRLGFGFPAIALTAGITFDEVIAVRNEPSESLLFHELVHVVQYRLLGISRFAFEYALGFLATRCYEEIPLERTAYSLEERFWVRREAFRVAAEVSRWRNEANSDRTRQ